MPPQKAQKQPQIALCCLEAELGSGTSIMSQPCFLLPFPWGMLYPHPKTPPTKLPLDEKYWFSWWLEQAWFPLAIMFFFLWTPLPPPLNNTSMWSSPLSTTRLKAYCLPGLTSTIDLQVEPYTAVVTAAATTNGYSAQLYPQPIDWQRSSLTGTTSRIPPGVTSAVPNV